MSNIPEQAAGNASDEQHQRGHNTPNESKPLSPHATLTSTQAGTTTGEGASTAKPLKRQQTETQTGEQQAGEKTDNQANPKTDGTAGEGIPPAGGVDPVLGDDEPPARESLGAAFKRRMEREGRWRAVSLVRDRMMVESKKAIPDKDARRAWVYGELDRMYPPPEKDTGVQPETDTISESTGTVVQPETDTVSVGRSDDGQIRGLGEIPKDWPELPANASIAADVGWVQANRLRVVEERPGRATLVRLDQALSPAPSWAALGWLETSIRSYAKFVDVVAKVSGSSDDEAAVLKRERRSIDEVKALLAEMEDAGRSAK